jgi:hypothetical protein
MVVVEAIIGTSAGDRRFHRAGVSIVARMSASDMRVHRSLHSASLHAGYERGAASDIRIDTARSW